jgi:hypothetical protein
VSGALYVGGLVGDQEEGTITNGYWNSSAEQTVNGMPQSKGVGAAIDNTVSMTSAEMQTNAFAAMLTSNSTAAGNPKRWKHDSMVNNGYPVIENTVGGDTTAPVLTGTG